MEYLLVSLMGTSKGGRFLILEVDYLSQSRLVHSQEASTLWWKFHDCKKGMCYARLISTHSTYFQARIRPGPEAHSTFNNITKDNWMSNFSMVSFAPYFLLNFALYWVSVELRQSTQYRSQRISGPVVISLQIGVRSASAIRKCIAFFWDGRWFDLGLIQLI